MAYSNVWSVTAPLDTQAANQGAVDFRATKLDVMQRIASFGAGTFANRPTPEATSGTADWTGVMYWATDTAQVFRWSGTAWVDISSNIPTPSSNVHKFTNIIPVTPTDNGSSHDGQLITLPANTLTSTSVILINAIATVASGQTNPFSKIGLAFAATIIAEYRSDLLPIGTFATGQFIKLSAVVTCTSSVVQQSFGSAYIAVVGPSSSNPTYSMGNAPGGDITNSIIINTEIEGGINSGTAISFTSLSAIVFN